MTSMLFIETISFLCGVIKMKLSLKHWGKTYFVHFILGIWGIPIGIIIGIMDTAFGKVLLEITDIRGQYPQYFIPFLPVAGVVIAYCYMRFGGKSGKGMNLIFEVGHGREECIPLRLIPFVISGTWITHLFGGSAGREGVAVQIGAAFSHWAGKRLPVKNSSDICLIAGMAAGFAGLFQTPVAAVLFAMEVLVAGELRYDALFPAVTASFAASTTSRMLGLEKFTFALTEELSLDGIMMIRLVAAGLLFGLAGGMFAWALKKTKQILAEKIENPMLRIGLTGIGLSILFLLFYQGRYSGLGTNLIQECFYGGTIYPWDWLFKAALTVLTLSAGFQGGEVTPLFATGASLGALAAGILGLPLPFAAALGYAALFGGATNTLLAAVFIGAEVFGFEYLPYFFIVCAVSYTFNMNKSIYSLQKLKPCRHVSSAWGKKEEKTV